MSIEYLSTTFQYRLCHFCNAAAKVIDGKGIANDWEKSIAAEAEELTKELGRPPGLAVIVAGERPDSAIYVQRKQDACKRVLRQPDTHCSSMPPNPMFSTHMLQACSKARGPVAPLLRPSCL